MEVKLPTSLGPENPFVLTISTPEELIRKRPSSAPCENNSLILLVGILPSYQVHLQTDSPTLQMMCKQSPAIVEGLGREREQPQCCRDL